MAKYVAQVIMLGAQVVGRAFTRALKQEFAASQSAANQRRSNNGSDGNDRVINAKLGMSYQEALQILNIETEKLSHSDRDLIAKKFNHLFDVNDKSKGGSFYLQSKKCVQNWKLLDRHCNAFRTLSTSYGNQTVQSFQFFRGFATTNGFQKNDSNNVFEEALSQQNIENCLNVLKSVSIVPPKKGLARIGRTPNIAKAAVLVPFCRDEKGEPGILFTQRSFSLSYHRGEVCFPGGVEEADDNNQMIRTAVRETVEELGIDESRIKVYGVLNAVPSSTNSHVYPVLGFIDLTGIDLNSNINREEVENVFVVPLKRLCEVTNWRSTQWKAGWVTPVYRDKSADIPRVWGLTAGILYFVLRGLLPNAFKFEFNFMSFFSKPK